MAAPATVEAQISGLQRANNLFSSSPPGSLEVGNDCVIDQSNVLGPRRGFDVLGTFGGTAARAGQLHYYGATALVQYLNGSGFGTVGHLSGSSFTDFAGTYAPINYGAPVNRMAFLNAQGNCYFMAQDGMRVMDGPTTEPIQAGVAKGLYTSPINASNNGWQTHNTAVAYRGLWGIRDAQNNVKLGVPSGRAVLRNYILAPVGGCVINANVCTVTLNANAPHYLVTGNTVTLSPGEANFAAGSYVVTVTGANTFTFPLVHANATSTLAQEFQITRSATVREYMPPGITINHFYRLYRSDMSATADTAPSDELYLTYTIQPTAANIAAGYIDVNDITPESFLGDPLYTNEFDGVGLQQANERPPRSRSIADFDSRVFFGNTIQRQRFFLDMLGVGAPNGIQDGDRLLVTTLSTVFTFSFKNAPGAGEVQIFSSDTAALNIARTTDALIKVINASSSCPCFAYSLSSDDGIPGKMLLEEKLITGDLFYVGAPDRPLSFNPYMTNEVGANLASSDPNAQIHGLGYSKQGEPEAVPVFNWTTVGSQSWPILRVARIKSALVVFKQGDGIWSVTGTAPYRVEQISTANIAAPDSVAVLSDRLWAFTDQGIVSISESAGITVASRALETDILELFGAELATLAQYAFGVGYETDRAYLLWLPEVLAATTCTEAYRQSVATQAYTRWTKAATCGLVDPNTQKLVIGSGTANQVLVERKSFDSSDFVDEPRVLEVSDHVRLLTHSTTTVTIDRPVDVTVEAGDWLAQGALGSLILHVVAELNGAGNRIYTLTLLSTENWTDNLAVAVYQGISVDVRFNPITGGDPALSKLARQMTWLFKEAQFYSADAEFITDQSAGVSTIALLASGWGYQAWGRFAWGSPQLKVKRVDSLPESKRISSQLTVGFSIRQAYAAWKLQGFVLMMDGLGEQNSR